MTTVAAAALLLVHAGASALGLGRLTVQSTLGEALRAEIDITSITPEEAASLRASLASPEAFRAAGVDFNPALAGAQTAVVKRPDGRTVIRLTGDRSVGEPFLDVLLDFSWNGGRLQRSYTLLIDPPTRPASAAAAPLTAPAVATPPALATAPVPPAPVAPPPPPPRPQPAPPPPPRAAVTPPAPAPAPARAPAPVAAPKPASAATAEAASGDDYRVRRGDTLSGIAVSRLPAGVSLDQMLVSLYRGNPQAFVGNNMNRLRSGAVLNLPSAEEAGRIGAGEARQVIQAHSADFAEFRRQLAGAAPTVPANQPPRQTSGKVEAAVQDNKTAAAPPPPDKLTLSRGAVASSPEAKLSKEAERKAADDRVKELARNVTELQKLKEGSAAASAPAKVAAAAAAAAPVASSGLSLPVGAPAPASMPAAAPPAASQAVAAPVASAASVMAAAAPASAPASAPKKRAAASAPKPAPAPESPSFLESLSSSPFVLPLAVGVVALLAGLGLMRVRRRSQEATGETSFLESKLQPDSFFGVSGGQRVDTRDGDANSAASSSLNYSLSQLDAIGDVDPVAEADVYLAYGRDLQAEEILKEALRTDPGRAAIRSKLLEVYAKRVDLPAFEAQALQLREVVGDDGDDWIKAQAMGRQLDPGNPLYGAQGEPVDIDTSSEPPPDLRDPAPARPVEPDSYDAVPDIEKTLPLDEPAGRVADNGLDLDIDLETPATSDLAATQPADAELMLNNGDEAPATRVEDPLPELPTDELPRRDPPNSGPVDFDFGDLSLDLDDGSAPKAAAEAPAPAQARPAAELPDLGDEADAEVDGDDDDPLARKLELADEFRRIGDTEGARDLLEEVISQAEGSLRAKAQAMLDGLG